MPNLQNLFKAIPSTDKSLDALARAAGNGCSPDAVRLLAESPRPLIREAVSAYWDRRRDDVRGGKITEPGELSLDTRFDDMLSFVKRMAAPRMQPVINGTGVIIHTNTGRSILARSARDAISMAAAGNTSLEFDRETGGRGSRHSILTRLICDLTGAEDAVAVNNNAAGVLLAMDSLCRGGEVIISRGELVEIGGSFRIPDVMSASGVALHEVGTTNRTHPGDYLDAINENTRAIVRVHTSNYRVIGFHTAVPTDKLAQLAHEKGLPLINDLGSGSLVNLAVCGLPPEPTVPECIRQGCDLVLFSGDKLLGGPQAGIIAGKKEFLSRIRKNPLLRAMRLDKLVYAGLEATLRLYYEPEKAMREIPTLSELMVRPEELDTRARGLKWRLARVLGSSCSISLAKDSSRTGGGAFPEYPLETTLVCLKPKEISPQELRSRLLADTPILIGRVENDAFCLDPRTLRDEDIPAAAKLLNNALKNH